MSKTIIRVQKNKENPYVMINKAASQDSGLSWKAKGIHAYLLGLPDNWKIYIDELKNHAKDGVDSTSKGINELIEAGYILRNHIKDEKGRFIGYEYIIYEVPQDTTNTSVSPEKGKSSSGKSRYGKTAATNKELKLNTNKTKKTTTIQKPKTVVVDSIPKQIIQEYKTKITTTIKDEVSDKAISELIQEHGADKIDKYLENWNNFDLSKVKSNSAFFVSAVKDGFAIPVKKITNDNRSNFKEREYNFGNSIYANCAK
jgi:hypothetical protein